MGRVTAKELLAGVTINEDWNSLHDFRGLSEGALYHMDTYFQVRREIFDIAYDAYISVDGSSILSQEYYDILMDECDQVLDGIVRLDSLGGLTATEIVSMAVSDAASRLLELDLTIFDSLISIISTVSVLFAGAFLALGPFERIRLKEFSMFDLVEKIYERI